MSGPPLSPLDWLPLLWSPDAKDPLAALLPRDGPALTAFYDRLRAYVESAPRLRAGRIDPAAIVRGEIVSMGEGSVIEAGAVVHESCRLVLGERSRVRSGAVLRDEVVIGADCQIGAQCEIARSLVLGPNTYLGHYVYLGDSILGRDVMVAGFVAIANTMLKQGHVPLIAGAVRIDSGRSRLGVLAGDGVRFGGSIFICPGCIVEPGLTLPPAVVLHGLIDKARRDRLMRQFFEEWVEE